MSLLMFIHEDDGFVVVTDTLATKVKELSCGGTIYADSEDPRMIAELRQRGVSAVGVKKGPGSVEHGIRWLQNLGAIIVDPARTPNIAREFRQYEYTKDRQGNFLPDVPDKDNHTIDSCRYAMRPVMDNESMSAPPPDYGNDRESYWR